MVVHLPKVELHQAVFAVDGRGDSTPRPTRDPSIMWVSRRGRNRHGLMLRHSGGLQDSLHFELDIQVRVAIVICINSHKLFHFL